MDSPVLPPPFTLGSAGGSNQDSRILHDGSLLTGDRPESLPMDSAVSRSTGGRHGNKMSLHEKSSAAVSSVVVGIGLNEDHISACALSKIGVDAVKQGNHCNNACYDSESIDLEHFKNSPGYSPIFSLGTTPSKSPLPAIVEGGDD